jgi:hypothetical protein
VVAHAEQLSFEDLFADIWMVRTIGVAQLRARPLGALTAAAAMIVPGRPGPPGVEAILIDAAERIGDPVGEAARCLLGLAPGTRGHSLKHRRVMAAEAYNVSFSTFREKAQKTPSRETTTIEQLADAILGLLADASLRDAHAHLQRDEPTDERLAFQWVRRFEAYYRLWTPAWALGADLTAYRATLLEAGGRWDRAPGTQSPEDPGDTQEGQAQGYARFALYNYAAFELELRKFRTRHGGLWLLSDENAERDLADSAYRIGWHTPFNERDQSWLRLTLQQAPGQELHAFLDVLKSDRIGRATHDEWQEWAATCACTWTEDGDTSDEHFPTTRHLDGIDPNCSLHLVVAACGDYVDLVDREWSKIANAFHIPENVRRGVSPAMLYARHSQPESGSR